MGAQKARRRRPPAPDRRLPALEDRRWRGHQQPSKRCTILPWGLRLGASWLHLEQTCLLIEHRLAAGGVLKALQPSAPAADWTADLRKIPAADIDRAALAVGAEVGWIWRGHSSFRPTLSRKSPRCARRISATRLRRTTSATPKTISTEARLRWSGVNRAGYGFDGDLAQTILWTWIFMGTPWHRRRDRRLRRSPAMRPDNAGDFIDLEAAAAARD